VPQLKNIKKTNLRKFGNGMILKALKKYKLSFNKCIIISDRRLDMLAAKKRILNLNTRQKDLLKHRLKTFSIELTLLKDKN
tara:strand:- start:36 stop:278 length:243 start_codon:yes stop_codon:yes gene_type:complete